MKQIGKGHPTLSSSPITILHIVHGPGNIKEFCGQDHDLLKKWVLVQIEPSKMRRSNFLPPVSHEYFAFSCLIKKGTNLGPPDSESLRKAAFGDTHIIHFGPHPICPKITTSLSYRTHHNLKLLAVVEKIAMQSETIPSSHYN